MSVHRHGRPDVPATADVLVAIGSDDVGQQAAPGEVVAVAEHVLLDDDVRVGQHGGEAAGERPAAGPRDQVGVDRRGA